MYRTQQKHVCSVPLCYWYYTRVSNFLYISATIGLSKTSHWCIPICFSRNIISSRHPKGNYILEQKPNFYATFYVHIGQKPIFPVFHGQIWPKLHPTLLNRTSHFRHFSTECSSNHRENSTWWKIQLYPTGKTHQKRSQSYHYSHLRWRHQRPTQASSITKSCMIHIKPKSTPYPLL